jgi:SMC interacting uncharacterized protein involved in chromosome segregation
MNPESQQDVDLLQTQTQRRPVSLNEFLQHFESMVSEKNALELRLSLALREKAELDQVHQRTRVDFDAERSRLNAEIDTLRGQLSGRSESFGSVLGAKERLIRDEFERKYQDLLVQVRRERTKHGEVVQNLKKQLSACICHLSDGDGIVEREGMPFQLKLRRPGHTLKR